MRILSPLWEHTVILVIFLFKRFRRASFVEMTAMCNSASSFRYCSRSVLVVFCLFTFVVCQTLKGLELVFSRHGQLIMPLLFCIPVHV